MPVQAPSRPAISGPAFFIGQKSDGLISFGSGQPDLPPPPQVFEILKDYRDFKYGPVQGDPRLREALAKEYPSATADQVVITNGASEAIDLVLRAVSVPGGTVALPRPYYYAYPHNVTLAGMTPVYYDLVEGKIDFDAFAKVAEGARAVLINSPGNPTGTVQEIPVLKKIEAFCEERGIYLLSDEVYKDLIYVRENYSMRGSRVATIGSFSKTYAMCGLRVGYLYTRDVDLVRKAVEIKNYTSMNTSIAGQAMALAALSAPESYVREMVAVWHARRDLMYQGLRALGLEVTEPEGAFYLLPAFTQSGRVVADLYHDYKIITYDGAWFGAPEHVRFSYALDLEKIEEGLRRLKEFLEKDYSAY